MHLRESERFLREAQEAGGVGCFSLDINLGIWKSSETFDAIFGISPDYPRDVPGWLELVAPDARESHRQQLLEVIQDQGRFDLEFRILRRQDGRERWVTGHGSLERDIQGQRNRIVGTMLDITERKLAEAKVFRMNEELEQRVKDRTAQLEAANKEMEAFSYSVSHDLRAPLRSIDGFSLALLEDHHNQLCDAGRQYLSRIQSASYRMGQLIEDLLKLSSINRSELELSEFDLSDLCRDALDELPQDSSSRRVNVSLEKGLRIRADHGLMLVALENLLRNAVKFTSKSKDPSIEVGASLSLTGGRTFFIRDNGAGFEMAHADKLFNAFQRLHAATEFEGTGIGLAIVQRIIHRHGGRIWAEAKPGEGATFFFTIPQAENGPMGKPVENVD